MTKAVPLFLLATLCAPLCAAQTLSTDVRPAVSIADTAKTAPARVDSVQAKLYRVLKRPVNKEEMRGFLAAFEMKDAVKPESSAVNWLYRDKQGRALTYEPGMSEVGYVFEKVPVLAQGDIVPDSLIRDKTDPLLKSLLKGRADRYVFANYEVTMMQSRDPKAEGGVSPAVPAFYTGRYVRKIDERIVLGDAFQVRVGIGERGAVNAFSFRDPVLGEGGSVRVPSKESISDSLIRWAKSRSRTTRLTFPYHPDKLRIRTLKPIKVIESYVLSEEKFRDAPQRNGTYLMPSVTVLAQATVIPSTRKNGIPPPPDPVLLHFHFPCRPGAGLCWPDHGQDLQSGGPSTAVPTAPRP